MGYSRPRTLTLFGMHTTAMNPVDNTTYYMGAGAVSIGTSSGVRRFYPPFNGIIRHVHIVINSATAAGTNEDWTISLTDGTTTTAVKTVGANTQYRIWDNDNINFPVTKDIPIYFVMLTPTWVTNPEGCTVWMTLELEYA